MREGVGAQITPKGSKSVALKRKNKILALRTRHNKRTELQSKAQNTILVERRHRDTTTSTTATLTTQSTFPNTPVEMLQEDFKVSNLTYFSLSELKDPNGFPSMTPKVSLTSAVGINGRGGKVGVDIEEGHPQGWACWLQAPPPSVQQ